MGLVAGDPAGLVRATNTTLKFPQHPGRFGFRMVDARGMTFDIPAPGGSFPWGNQSGVLLEQRGIVVAVTNLVAPSRTVFST